MALTDYTKTNIVEKDITELTIASGAVTITQGYHSVGSETGASDDLATVNGGTVAQRLIIKAKTGHTITLKHGAGNVQLGSAADIVLASGEELELHYDDGFVWRDLSGGGSGGTVTSVALTVPTEFSVSGSPVTGSGTLAVSKANQSANLVYAGPSSGGAAAPTFRSLVSADIPSLSGLYANVSLSNLSGATSDMLPQYLLRQPTANWSIDASALYMGGIGGAAVAAQKLTVYTGADANKGIVIRANSATQSANLQEWQNNSGTILATIDATGGLIFGTTTPGSITTRIFGFTTYTPTGSEIYQSIRIIPSINPSVNTTARMWGAVFQPGYSGSGNIQSIYGVNTLVSISGSGRATLEITGGDFTVGNVGTGTAANVYGGRFIVRQQNPSTGSLWDNAFGGYFGIEIQASSAGSITNGYVGYFRPANNGTGTVTNLYGLYVADVSFGTTINSAITTNAGNVVFNEGGHASTNVRAEGDTDQYLLFTQASTDRAAVGTSSPSTKFHVLLSDAGTNAVTNVLTIGHDSTGTPAAGFGTGLIFEGKSSTTIGQSMSRLYNEWVVATHASRTARSTWSVYDTAERVGIQIEASGTAAKVGFFGVAPALRAAAYTPTNVTTDRSYDANATTLDEVADVLGTLIADLQVYGLLA